MKAGPGPGEGLQGARPGNAGKATRSAFGVMADGVESGAMQPGAGDRGPVTVPGVGPEGAHEVGLQKVNQFLVLALAADGGEFEILCVRSPVERALHV